MGIFKIHDGRTSFWQWDLGCKLIVCDEVSREIHFSNGTGNVALVCEVYELDGQRVVDVPNILLQSAKTLTVYDCVNTDNGGRTLRAAYFAVNPRERPADYVYTETEVRTWEALADRVEALEGGGSGGGGLSVTDDGNGNVAINSTGTVSITDDGNGNVVIA